MADISSTIQRYQENFQILPGIDTTKSHIFLKNAINVKNTYDIKSKFADQIRALFTSDSSPREYNIDEEIIADLIKAIFNEIQIFTNRQLLESINEGVEWLSRTFNDGYYRKWGLLTENLYQISSSSTFKSPEWIASFAWEKLKNLEDKNRDNLLPYCVSDVGSGMIDVSTINDMYINHNIQHFVMFDDGAYSGLQKSTAIFIHAWKALTSNPNVNKPFSIIVIIPFLTHKAIDTFRRAVITYNLGFNKEFINHEHNYCEWEDTINNRSVFIWGGKVIMPNTTNIVYEQVSKLIKPTPKTYALCNAIYNFIIKDILTDFGGTLGAAMCIFEHKLPDFLSLPTVVANMFMENQFMNSNYSVNPPYKHIPKNPRRDSSKVFDCSIKVAPAQASGGAAKKTKEKITYCKKKYTVLLSKRGHKYIIHKDRKVYLKSFHHL